ncbi:transposase [Streptomyces olivaceoviridis]|uniref:transposase n=1 Tax=Streptomyces olivaceoviridis TaxID=1921 RepID=UPI0036C1A81A
MPAPRKYPDELRERAVREVRTTGRPIAHVAKDLGIHKEALRGWVRQAEADAGERDDRLTTAEREELRQLRRTSAGRTGDGAMETEDQEGLRADPSQRQGVAICVDSLHRPARRGRGRRVRRLGRGLV